MRPHREDGYVFLSTPSARRATQAEQMRDSLRDISIHALREEGDTQRTKDRPRP